MKKQILSILLIPFLFLNISWSQNVNKLSPQVKQTIDDKYNKLLKKKKVVGASIAIIDNGEIVYATGYGFEDKEKGISADAETLYRIGSSAKIFTVIAVMQLYEKGLLNINESIKKYIPELQISTRFDDENEIFIKDIMSHVAGLPSDIINGFMGDSLPDINWTINELNKHTTISPNRYLMAYCNVGYALLGELVHRVSGMSYEAYLQEHLFTPLQMNTSTLGFDLNTLSKGYVAKKLFVPEKLRDQAAGDITSNVLEMANLITMLLHDGKFGDQDIISKKYFDQIEADRLVNNSLKTSRTYGYGLGIFPISLKDNNETKNDILYSHGGDIIAFHGDFAYIPSLNVGAVILTNTDNGTSVRSAIKLLKLYLKEAKGITLERQTKTIEKIKTTISNNDIVGVYNLGLNMGLMEVTDAEKIKFKIDGQKIVLNRKPNSYTYNVKAILFGFIPIKIKSMQMKFEKNRQGVFFKRINVEKKRERYFAKKTKMVKTPDSWKAKFGDYQVINNISNCEECLVNLEGVKAKIFEEKGFLILEMLTDKISEFSGKFYLSVISDDMAVTGGVGRNSSLTLKILDNGNISFSGFEFEKLIN